MRAKRFDEKFDSPLCDFSLYELFHSVTSAK
jgi:hypothetical protein